MRRRRLQTFLIGLGTLFVAILLGFGWMGYLGGDPFTSVTPQGYRPQAGAPVAILLSGDGGFRLGLGKYVARRLEHEGVPVVGVNSLTYFRKTRTPTEAGRLVEDAVLRAKAINPAGRIVLIGQSFGADMLHVGLSALPAEQRRAIAAVALVVPGAAVEFRASPAEIFTFMIAEHDALPTAQKLDWVPTLCIYGEQEAHSLCPLLRQANARIVRLPGGHQLNWDSRAIEQEIMGLMKRAGVAPHG